MRALIHHTFGEPEDVLAVEEHEKPEPGPGQVRLRVLLAPIHNHDVLTVRGHYGIKPQLPAVAGTEAVGIVDALGAGVEHLTIGQRVATGSTPGTWAEYVIASARGVVPVPDSLSDESAAQLVSMPFSAISLLQFLDLKEGDWLVHNAANGAVGRMLAQLCAARGINVLGLVRRAAGIEELRAQGIGNVVATDQPHWRDQAAKLTGGASIVAGVDSVGGSASGEVLSLLSENATLAVFGAMHSPTMQLASADIIFKQITIKGFWGSKASTWLTPDDVTALFAELIQRATEGTLTLPSAGVFDANDVAAAMRLSSTPGRVGKVLFRF